LKTIGTELGSSQDNLMIDVKTRAEYEKEFNLLQEIAKNSTVYDRYYDLENYVKDLRLQVKNITEISANLSKQPPLAATAQINAAQLTKLKDEIAKLIDDIDTHEGQMQRILMQISPSEKEMYTLATDIEILKMKIAENEDRIIEYQTNSPLPSSVLDLRNGTLFKKTLKDMIKLEQDIKKTNVRSYKIIHFH